MQASIREYLGEMEEARRLSEQALERISRVVEMEPNLAVHQLELRAARGRLYRLYALAGQRREDRRAEEVEGWVITAANMAGYGYRIGDRIAVLEKAVELSRGLAPGHAAELELSRSLGTLCGALQTQAHFESGAAREAVLHRARAAGSEAKRRFEQLQREQRMQGLDLNPFYANNGTLANVDAHLREIEQAKTAQR